MPLTPAEVHNVAFKKPPIGKRGYDEEEVDAFLDIVEVELSRLIEENNDLRGRSVATVPRRRRAGGRTQGRRAARRGGGGTRRGPRGEPSACSARSPSWRAHCHRARTARSSRSSQLQQQLARTEQQLAESRRQLEQAAQQAGCAEAAARPRRRASAAAEAAPSRTLTRRPSRCSRSRSRPPTSTWPSPRPRPTGWSPRRGRRREHRRRGAAAAPTQQRRRGRGARPAARRGEHRAGNAHGAGCRAARGHHHRPVRAAQGGSGAPRRGAAHVRARVPHPAQELPGVAVARPRRERRRRAGAERGDLPRRHRADPVRRSPGTTQRVARRSGRSDVRWS